MAAMNQAFQEEYAAMGRGFAEEQAAMEERREVGR